MSTEGNGSLNILNSKDDVEKKYQYQHVHIVSLLFVNFNYF